jgi:hypothetical protein
VLHEDPAFGSLPGHSRPVRSPYGTPEHPLYPRRRRTGGLNLLPMMLLLALGIGATSIIGEHLTAPEPDVVLGTGLAFSADGLVLVPYDRNGSGGLVAEATAGMFAARLAAVDLASGETRWDVRLADELAWDAAVVAAGVEYAYVATEDGLQIRDLDDGSLVTAGGAVPGLESAGPGTAAYGFDPAAGAVVALDVDGGLHTIDLDGLEAAPAGEAVTEAWTGRLSAEGTLPEIGGMTSTEASVGEDRTLRVEPTAEDSLGGVLVIEGHGIEGRGGRRVLGTRAYYGAGIVLDHTAAAAVGEIAVGEIDVGEIDVDGLIRDILEDPAAAVDLALPDNAAAGATTGHALVEHRPDPGAEGFALTVIDLKTGRATASVATADHLGRSLTGPGGHTVVLTTAADGAWLSELVIVAPDGSIDRVDFGDLDLLGRPDLGRNL